MNTSLVLCLLRSDDKRPMSTSRRHDRVNIASTNVKHQQPQQTIKIHVVSTRLS